MFLQSKYIQTQNYKIRKVVAEGNFDYIAGKGKNGKQPGLLLENWCVCVV